MKKKIKNPAKYELFLPKPWPCFKFLTGILGYNPHFKGLTVSYKFLKVYLKLGKIES